MVSLLEQPTPAMSERNRDAYKSRQRTNWQQRYAVRGRVTIGRWWNVIPHQPLRKIGTTSLGTPRGQRASHSPIPAISVHRRPFQCDPPRHHDGISVPPSCLLFNSLRSNIVRACVFSIPFDQSILP
jgi:hypothetical protein